MLKLFVALRKVLVRASGVHRCALNPKISATRRSTTKFIVNVAPLIASLAAHHKSLLCTVDAADFLSDIPLKFAPRPVHIHQQAQLRFLTDNTLKKFHILKLDEKFVTVFNRF
jgi:hypothetical protein